MRRITIVVYQVFDKHATLLVVVFVPTQGIYKTYQGVQWMAEEVMLRRTAVYR